MIVFVVVFGAKFRHLHPDDSFAAAKIERAGRLMRFSCAAGTSRFAVIAGHVVCITSTVTVDVGTVLQCVSLKRTVLTMIVSIHSSSSNGGEFCDSSGYMKIRPAERRRWRSELFQNRQSLVNDVAVDSAVFKVAGCGLGHR